MHLYVNFCVSFLSSWVLISHICFLQLRSEFLGRNLQGRGPGSAPALPPVTGPSWAGGLWGYIFPMDSPPGPSARAGAGQVDPRAPGGTEGTSSGAGRGCLSRGLPVPGDARGGDGSYSSLQPGRSHAVASEAQPCRGLRGPGSRRGQPQPRLPMPTGLEGHFSPPQEVCFFEVSQGFRT